MDAKKLDGIRKRCEVATKLLRPNGGFDCNKNVYEYMEVADAYLQDVPALLDEVSRLNLKVYEQDNIIQHLKDEKLPFPWMAEYMEPLKARDKVIKLEAENATLRRERDAAVQDINDIINYPNCSKCKNHLDNECCVEGFCGQAEWRGVQKEEVEPSDA